MSEHANVMMATRSASTPRSPVDEDYEDNVFENDWVASGSRSLYVRPTLSLFHLKIRSLAGTQLP
jgi:hypothetical protein